MSGAASGNFGTVQLPSINPLAAYYASGKSQADIAATNVANQGAQQTLADRATLRDQAAGLASLDPQVRAAAAANAMTLPQAGGNTVAPSLLDAANANALTLKTPAEVALIGGQARTANSAADLASGTLGSNITIAGNQAAAGGLANTGTQMANAATARGGVGSVATSILYAPAPQQDAIYQQMLPQLAAAGLKNLPAHYPGNDAFNALRVSGLTVPQQVEQIGNMPSTDPFRTGLSGPMAQSESGGNSRSVNPQGYSGLYNQGAARLASVGAYTPANGENPNANTWNGTFNIPGHPEVKTYAQFLASPAAQHMAFAQEIAGTDHAIARTPGAANLDQNGLRAVAHLGGVDGMQRFVATGGAYNPADANGTRLSDYYNKFAQGGAPALQSAFGHPDGPASVMASRAAMAAQAMPPGQLAAAGLNPDGSVAAVPSATPAQMPVAAPDAAPPQPAPVTSVSNPPSPTPAPALPAAPVDTGNAGPNVPPVAPGFGPATAPMPPAGVQAPQTGVAMTSPPQNSLMPPASAQAPGPQNGLMPAASAQPPGGIPGPVPGAQPLYVRGAPVPASVPGFIQTINPDGTRGMMRAPGAPPEIQYEKTDNAIIGIDKITNQVVSSVPTVNSARVMMVDAIDPKTGKAGKQATQDGVAVGPVFPGTGATAQMDAYKSDGKDMKEMGQSAATAQGNMPRLNEMADLIPQVSTGGLAPETRAKLSGILEGLGIPADTIKRFDGLSSGAQAQLLTKLTVSTASAAAKDNTGSNTGIESTKLSLGANPGMALLPDANLRVTNMLRVQNQATQDYNQAAQQHFSQQEDSLMKGGQYEPMTKFNREWQAQANPQVYAAATAILNGDKYADWSSRLKNPAEIQRAQDIAARVDPNITVPQKGAGAIDRLSRQSPTSQTPAAAPLSFPSSAVDYLKANPSLAAQFDQKYGAGASQRALGQ